jgi:hypothetical protein
MILYFDNLIIEAPLVPDCYAGLRQIRCTDSNYRDQTRLDIAMYTLASYAMMEWTGVLIRYECADERQDPIFAAFVRDLFPTAVLLRGRSMSQTEFARSFEMLSEMPDDWVFVACNNDHPIVAPSLEVLDNAMAAAVDVAATAEFVSVPYSHLVELRCGSDPRYTLAWYVGRRYRRIAEADRYSVVTSTFGYVAGVQIMHKRMLGRLINGKDYGNQVLRRTDDMDGGLIPNQHMVIPKGRVGDHYDGYTNGRRFGQFLPNEIYPPLFIPPGFFENNIRIAYGFATIRPGSVNVNPAAPLYSFQDARGGTDLKCRLEDLPAFWKPRIAEIDINSDADQRELRRQALAAERKMNSPWPKLPAVVSLSIVAYYWARGPLVEMFYGAARRVPFLQALWHRLKRPFLRARRSGEPT